MSLETIAADLGLRVERRPVHVRELDSFGEEGVADPTLVRLYRRLLGIQCGEVEDEHGWMAPIE